MDAFADLRTKFDNMTTEQKGQFCTNFKRIAHSSNNEQQMQFLDDCILKYESIINQGEQHSVTAIQEPISHNAAEPSQLPPENYAEKNSTSSGTSILKSRFNSLTSKLNEMAGGSGSVDLRLRDLFSSVLKKHTRAESDEIFIAGTVHTTPDESDIVVSWPKPWLFSRVLLALLATFALLYICSIQFQNPNMLPGLMFIGALAMPFSVLIFIFETNAPRNISIFEVIKMFFVGGVSSLVLTLLLFEIFPVADLDYIGAVTVGFVEELGKLLAIVIFVRILNPRYILNGMLIGAAIGAGFAVFETAGYGFRFLVMSGFNIDMMIDVLFLRAWSSIGAHVVWAAITGAALVLVKGRNPFQMKNIIAPRFLSFFVIPVLLHAIWNSPLLAGNMTTIYFKMIFLIIAAWVVILVLLNAGLKQIRKTGPGVSK